MPTWTEIEQLLKKTRETYHLHDVHPEHLVRRLCDAIEAHGEAGSKHDLVSIEATYNRTDNRRQSNMVHVWLYPGEAVAVISFGPRAVPLTKQDTLAQLNVEDPDHGD
jgi:hypothetical protein